MKKTAARRTNDDFIAPARRAFRRVAKKLREENARLGLPLIQGEQGHLKRVRPATTIAERAARADFKKVDAVLARVPAVPPQPGDDR